MVNDEKNFIRPVLKHGPRSLTCMRVEEFFKLVGETKVIKVLPFFIFLRFGKYWLDFFRMDPSYSTYDGTRKMVNYAWTGWSQRKLWWRPEVILTCKSFVWF